MQEQPTAEHRWLDRLVGEWTYAAEARMGPDEPPLQATGTESVRSLGGLWVVAEGKGEMPGGGAATTLMTLGYDPKAGRYVGSWVGSMMTHLWLYDCSMDPGGTRLTLAADGPSMRGDGTLSRYEDILEIVSDDHRRMRSRVRGEDGGWNEFMVADYRRKAQARSRA
jgi:hypothetical protein